MMKAVLFDLDGTLWAPTAPPDFGHITELQAARIAPLMSRTTSSVFAAAGFLQMFWTANGLRLQANGADPLIREP